MTVDVFDRFQHSADFRSRTQLKEWNSSLSTKIIASADVTITLMFLSPAPLRTIFKILWTACSHFEQRHYEVLVVALFPPAVTSVIGVDWKW